MDINKNTYIHTYIFMTISNVWWGWKWKVPYESSTGSSLRVARRGLGYLRMHANDGQRLMSRISRSSAIGGAFTEIM